MEAVKSNLDYGSGGGLSSKHLARGCSTAPGCDFPVYYPGKEDPHTNPKRKQGPPRLRFGLVLINFLAGVNNREPAATGHPLAVYVKNEEN